MSDLRPERLHLQDNNSQHLSICGKSFVADVSGALFWPSEYALIVADLGLGQASSYIARGVPGPAADAKETLVKLAKTIDSYGARTVIVLGHDFADWGTAPSESAPAIDDDILQILKIMQEDCEWIWIDTAHPCSDEPVSGRESGTKPIGTVVGELTAAGITLRHKPTSHAMTHEIAGCLQPAARVSTYGHVMRRPCFIGNGRRLILPAFGSYSGGVNVLDQSFDHLFGKSGLTVWLLGQDGVYPVSTRRLIADPQTD